MGYDNRFTDKDSVSCKDGDNRIVEVRSDEVHLKITIPDKTDDNKKGDK